MDTSNIDFTGLLNNIVPVTLGNIVGGSVLVGAFTGLHIYVIVEKRIK